MMMSYKEIRNCRACHGELEEVFDFGMHQVVNFGTREDLVSPLHLVLCKSCKLLQLKHSVDPDKLFRQYYYRSGINQTMRNHLQSIVEDIEKRVEINKNDLVIDIGANDGTLLSYYHNLPSFRVGFEPATALAVEASAKLGTPIINDYFSTKIPGFTDYPTKAITAIAMFYDLDDPGKFLDDVKQVLAPDGLFVLEQNYLVPMLENNRVDNCVKPDTLILGDNKQISEYAKNDLVFGANGLLNPVKQTMQREYDGDLITFRPRYLSPITCTPDHPLLIVRRNQIEFPLGQLRRKRSFETQWIVAKDIHVGDYVAVPRLKQGKTEPIDLTEYNKTKSRFYRRGLRKLVLDAHTAWFIGLYVAEGHSNKTQVGNEYITFSLHKKETYLVNKISEVAKQLGYSTTVIKNKENGINVRIFCTALARFFKQACGAHAKEKQIPDCIMESNTIVRRAFLRGLFAGDGYVNRSKDQVHLHTASYKLAQQAQLLIASLGGMIGISHADAPTPRKMKDHIIKGGESWQLRGRSADLAWTFGYSHRDRTNRQYQKTQDFIFVPIEQISRDVWVGKVCNIETGDNSYLVSNAVVHNCSAEHLCYYSVSTLNSLLLNHELWLEDLQFDDINGGVFRAYIRHGLKTMNEGPVIDACLKEINLHLSDIETYHKFVKRVLKNMAKLNEFISEKQDYESIDVYGASTRGLMVMQLANLGPQKIRQAVERNPAKVGTKYNGVPVVSEETMRDDPPDYLLMLAPDYLSEQLTREMKLVRKGTKLILPFPEPAILSIDKI